MLQHGRSGAMTWHLAEISAVVAPGAHAVLLADPWPQTPAIVEQLAAAA